jgi:hypothetical protein
VVGLEVLDNMPHDRLYFEGGRLTKQAVVSVKRDAEGREEDHEERKEVISDELCRQFVELYENMPSMDHISASKVLKSEGFFKRLQEVVRSYTSQVPDNIFAPTASLRLIQHIASNIPDHSLVMADFDSFLMPKNSIKGLNAPLVTNKLKDPTEWKTYDTYLIERGAADICFPVDFNFMQHAYQKITGNQATVYKTSQFVDQFALASWATTQNLFNPMRDEYFNTSFLVTERKK